MSTNVPVIAAEDGNAAPICTDCNLNNGRGGTWKCFDKEGNELEHGAPVPWRGSCKLTCEYNNSYDISKRIVCRWPHIGQEVQQWEPLWRLYKFLTLKKYKRNALMSSDDGWQCVPGLDDDDDDNEE